MQEILLPCDVEFLPLRLLRAGDITCYYEAGNLRYIKWGNTELIRMIYSAVRDENWDTLPMSVTDEAIEVSSDRFKISYNASYHSPGIDYKASMLIEGYDNTIRFRMHGEARSSFKKNRIGLCVLHPLKECMDREVIVSQPGGSIKTFVFPKLVSPHQPFTGIQKMEWTTSTGVNSRLNFEGELFETEDQRNWTDASYKTYSTPLSIPIPAIVEVGDKIHHDITLSASATGKVSSHQPKQREEKLPFPKIGFSRAEGASLLSEELQQLHREFPLDHYRISVNLSTLTWENELRQAAVEAESIGIKLALACYTDDDFDSMEDEFINCLHPIQQSVSSVLLIQPHYGVTSPEVLKSFYQKMRVYPSIAIGYGTSEHFATLNRNRPRDRHYDFLSFSIMPQVHAKDNRTIIENLESHMYNLLTVDSFSPGKPVHVSPVFFNSGDDERAHSNFATFWRIMCLQTLGAADVISFSEPGKSIGEVDEDNGLVSFYDLLRKINRFDPKWVIRRFSDEQLLMDGLLLENADGRRLWVSSPINEVLD